MKDNFIKIVKFLPVHLINNFVAAKKKKIYSKRFLYDLDP